MRMGLVISGSGQVSHYSGWVWSGLGLNFFRLPEWVCFGLVCISVTHYCGFGPQAWSEIDFFMRMGLVWSGSGQASQYSGWLWSGLGNEIFSLTRMGFVWVGLR
jgi:hypothetical protein